MPVTVPAPGSLARVALQVVHAIPLIRNFARDDHVPRVTDPQAARDPQSCLYAWVFKNKIRRGASRRTLTVSRRFRGTVKCRVTAFNTAGRTTALSRPYRVR